MATLYDEEQKKLEEERKKLQQQQTEAAAGQYGQAAIDAGKTTYNYTPSDALIAARQYLDAQAQQKPAQYNSRYTDQLAGILSRIQGRAPFQYDAAADPLYNIYKDLYIQNGRRAMQDTMGQAAALTGGYGNSYGQIAGQQQYGQYMEGLNAMIPQLQQQAYQQYQGEGDRLAQLYQLVNGAESMDYAKYRDLVGDWQTQQQLAQQMALQYAQMALQYEQANKSGGGGSPKQKEPANKQTEKMKYFENPLYRENSPYVEKIGPYTSDEYNNLISDLTKLDQTMKNASPQARAQESLVQYAEEHPGADKNGNIGGTAENRAKATQIAVDQIHNKQKALEEILKKFGGK